MQRGEISWGDKPSRAGRLKERERDRESYRERERDGEERERRQIKSQKSGSNFNAGQWAKFKLQLRREFFEFRILGECDPRVSEGQCPPKFAMLQTNWWAVQRQAGREKGREQEMFMKTINYREQKTQSILPVVEELRHNYLFFILYNIIYLYICMCTIGLYTHTYAHMYSEICKYISKANSYDKQNLFSFHLFEKGLTWIIPEQCYKSQKQTEYLNWWQLFLCSSSSALHNGAYA